MPLVLQIVCILMLLGSSANFEYSYYEFLRVVIAAVSAYLAYSFHQMEQKGWMFTFGVLAVLFNPVIPVHMSKYDWALIDFLSACVFFCSIFVFRKKKLLVPLSITFSVLASLLAGLWFFHAYIQNWISPSPPVEPTVAERNAAEFDRLLLESKQADSASAQRVSVKPKRISRSISLVTAASHKGWTLGSTKDQVSKVQGTPTAIIGNTWDYVLSSITFGPDNLVVGYADISQNLKIAKTKTIAKRAFHVGSTKSEVLLAQGAPSAIIGQTWDYDLSSVMFDNDKVSGYSEISNNLHIGAP